MNIPARWQATRLGELATYINGRAFKPAEWGKRGLPIIRIQNLNDPDASFNCFDGTIDEKHMVRDGDLLISWSASLGSFIWQRGAAVLNQHIFKAVPNEELVDKEFLHFLVSYLLSEIGNHTHGSTMKHITKGKFDNLPCGVPALKEQRRVVGRIKECLSRVEEMQRLREEAEREIAVLENAWLRQRLADLAFGWPQQELAAFADIRGGGSLPKGTATAGSNGDWLLVKVGDMNLPGNELEIVSAREFLSAGVADDAWPVGTVVFPKRGGAIATNKKRLLGRPALLDPNLMGVIAGSKKMRPAFLLAQFAILDLTTLTSGSTVPQLNRKDLAPLPFVVPDLVTQDAVISQAKEVSTRVRSMAKDMACGAELDALRESILREAFAGNL